MERILATLFMNFILIVFALAQQGHMFELRTADGSAVTQVKLAYVTMFSFDPEAIVSMDRDRMKVRLVDPVSVQTVIDGLAQNGAGDFVLVTCVGKPGIVAPDDDADSLPPNGDSFPSEQQHAAAKQQWAEQDSDAYQRFIQTLLSAIPVSHE